jgi:hypothetical protein
MYNTFGEYRSTLFRVCASCRERPASELLPKNQVEPGPRLAAHSCQEKEDGEDRKNSRP